MSDQAEELRKRIQRVDPWQGRALNAEAVLQRMAAQPCEETTLRGEIPCSERMTAADGWKVEDWCYTCQARAALSASQAGEGKKEPPRLTHEQTAYVIHGGHGFIPGPSGGLRPDDGICRECGYPEWNEVLHPQPAPKVDAKDTPAEDLALKAAQEVGEGELYPLDERERMLRRASIIQRIIEPALVAAREERDECVTQAEVARLQKLRDQDAAESREAALRAELRDSETAQKATLDAMLDDVGKLLEALGLPNVARPDSPHEVMLDCTRRVASLALVLRRIGSGQCEEQNLARELRCDERMGGVDGWKVEDWCYPCQAREAVKEKA